MTVVKHFYVKEIEDVIESYINLWPSRTLFIVLNTSFLQANCEWNVNSLCLHLKLKYKCLQWPKKGYDSDCNNPVLLICCVD